MAKAKEITTVRKTILKPSVNQVRDRTVQRYERRALHAIDTATRQAITLLFLAGGRIIAINIA